MFGKDSTKKPADPATNGEAHRETTNGDDSAPATIEGQTPASEPDELTKTLQERDMYKDLAYRAAAEMENYKRRAARDREELSAALKERFVTSILPAVDAFDMAAAAVDRDVPADVRKKYLDGYAAIARQILTSLEGMGLSVIPIPADAAFDPAYQEAVMTEEVAGLKDPIVLQVLQKGYRLDGRLIRPARVKVGMPVSTEGVTGSCGCDCVCDEPSDKTETSSNSQQER